MRDSVSSLIDVSIRIIRELKEASFEVYPYEEDAYVSIMARKIIQPLKIMSLAKGFNIGFYPADNFIEIRIYESN